MSEKKYLDIFLTEEDHMAKDMFRIIQLWEGGAQLGRFDVCRGYYDCNL